MDICRVRQWVVWRYDRKEKVPYSPRTGRRASVVDSSSTWGTFEDAQLVRDGYDGIGFVFTEDDPYCGVDLDDCVHDGLIEPWALEILESLDSCWEISPSGRGIHVYVIANKPGPRSKSGGVEMYESRHYFTVSDIQHSTIQGRQREIDELYRRLFPERPVADDGKPGEGFQGDDDALLKKMRNAGQWRAFRRLYDDGNAEFYLFLSEADMHLCGILAFWIGPDENRIEEWFRSSALAEYHLDRKVDPDQYLELTIQKAIDGCDYFYDPEWNSASPTVRDALMDRRRFVLDYAWASRSGPSDRDVYRALLRAAHKYGVEHSDGIKVAVSTRDLTLESGIGSRETVKRATNRLVEKHSLVRVLDSGGNRRATTYLLCEPDPNLVHNLNCVSYGLTSGQTLSLTSRIRNAGRTFGTLGKRNGQIIDLVHASRDPLSLDTLAQHLGVRKNHLKSRNIKMLLAEGFITGDDQGYDTPHDIQERLETFLEESGSNLAESLVKERIDRDREAWKRYQNKETDMREGDFHKEECSREDCEIMRDSHAAIEEFHAQLEGECTRSLTCNCLDCFLDNLAVGYVT
jgi:DNA-binding transcriptional regulator GbsR (MarR family)